MTHITRRVFVHSSLAAGATLSLSRSSHAAPNDTIGVAVIGAGGRGGTHIGEWLGDTRTEIRYIVDVDAKKGADRCSYIEVTFSAGGQTYEFELDDCLLINGRWYTLDNMR